MCEFCDGSNPEPFIPYRDCGIAVVVEASIKRDAYGGALLDFRCYSDGSCIGGSSKPIRYCPMCGHRLAERGQ